MPSRQSITKQQRKDLRQFAREHPNFRQNQLKNWFEATYCQKISQSSVSESLSPKFSSLDSDNVLPDSKRTRNPEHKEIEEALVKWIRESQNNIIPSHEVLRDRAKELWNDSHPGSSSQSLFTKSWSMGFVKRNKLQLSGEREPSNGVEISVEIPTGDQVELSAELVTEMPAEFLVITPAEVPQVDNVQMQIRKYHPADVYKCDTTRLFWKHSPDINAGIYLGGGDAIHGKRLTVHLCSNMDGSEKLQPWIVGMAENPPAFANTQINVHSLGCTWRNSQNASMSPEILREWLLKFDYRALRTGKKALLLLESSETHLAALSLVEQSLRNTKVCLLSPESEHHKPALEHTILGAFKMLYRQQYLRFMHTEYSASRTYLNTINELDAVKWSVQAWHNVSKEIIAHCWTKAGLSSLTESEVEGSSSILFIHEFMSNLYEGGCIHKPMSIRNFVDPDGEDANFDNHDIVTYNNGQLTPESFHSVNQDSAEEGVLEKTSCVSHAYASFCLDQLWNYVRQQKNARSIYFEAFSELENQIFQRRYVTRGSRSSNISDCPIDHGVCHQESILSSD